ncbi:hypothetical protein GRF29_1g2520410 [Pseudopithomyces chartarum]|uniref:Methyltransferase type 11 domain-containing protein n=1 Tax=Pseudopithomyces chartarum TaxID=1892770 RepID=A0AAN6M6V3_9PLEO|nr:hypothetical protein GRF29_1g2520410 [Pseudopithomyces chartarum]
MAFYKPHNTPLGRIEDRTLHPHRAPTTRLPQPSIAQTATTTQLSSPGPSKLQKRRPSRDDPLHTTTLNTYRAPTPKISMATGSQRGSATPTISTLAPASRSALPKPAPQSYSSRLPKLEVPPASTRTPSLVSGESASTIDSPRSNLIRRKQAASGIPGRRREHSGKMSSQDERYMATGIPGGYKDPFSETVLGISLPPTSTIFAHPEVELELPEYSHYDIELAPMDALPPPAPHYALSSTPSTRYSESPGAFSVSSTPTSMSSYSPGIAMSTKSIARTRQLSPSQAKPSVARYQTPEERAFSSVQEPSMSSLSTSTVSAGVIGTTDKSSMKRLPPKIAQFQSPPELAHLADQPQTSTASRRPARPSREGTPEMTGFRGPSPIIQSNMSSFPLSHKRSTSTSSTASATMDSRNRIGLFYRQPSRNPSPNPSITSGSVISSRLPISGPTSESKVEKQRSQTLPTSTSAPSPSKTSRFGFFSRRTKTDPVAPPPKTEKKTHRRGPAAGTGHEGYGRYAVRARNGSIASASSIGKSPSAATTTESLNQTPSTRKSSVTSTSSTDMDDFFLERLNPVVIRGTGSSAELTRSPDPLQSTSSLDIPSSGFSNLNTATNSSSNGGSGRNHPALLPSAMSDPVHSMSPVTKSTLSTHQLSESEDDSNRSFIPSLSTKRRSRASKILAVGSPVRNETGQLRKGSIDAVVSERKDSNWLRPSKKEKIEHGSSRPSRKWNFFQRAHGATQAPTPAPTPATEPSSSPIRLPASRSVAHYAIGDAQSGLDAEDIEAIMQEADSTPEEEAPLPGSTVDSEVADPNVVKKERLLSMLLPPKPIMPCDIMSTSRPASPKVFLRPNLQLQPRLKLDIGVTQEDGRLSPSMADLTPVTDLSPTSSLVDPLPPAHISESFQSSQVISEPGVLPPPPPIGFLPQTPFPDPAPRPSRLPQVGRIPQVVSSRNTTHRPHSRSFSRPFTTNQPGSSAPSGTSFDSIGSMSATFSPVEPYPILHGLNALTHGSAIATVSPSAEETFRQGEFFILPSRKGSAVSYSSSSGTWSFPATTGTAVVPTCGAPTSEDEVWNEYDDLIDEVLSPVHDQEPNFGVKSVQKRSSLGPLPLKLKHVKSPAQSEVSTPGVSTPSLHLRRSRLLAVLHSQSPTSSISLSEFLQEYGERNISVVDPLTGRLSFPSTAHMSIDSDSLKRAGSNRSSLPVSINLSSRHSKATLASISDKHRSSSSANRYRDTRLIEIAETQADGLSFMANLRFGALMTSKWLSFGRVIFSPAHFELGNPEHDRVLVIDGLGKDWSYYCALTYPEATIYNLGPGQSTPMASNNSVPEPWSTLKNHRHFNQTSLNDPFPFPKGFFACVVLRFPSALPSGVHRSVISECKRVLRPGGFLELTVLDLDLVNMGNRARRAVRGLKVKMQVADEAVSLRNVSDEIMGLVGRKGFTGCNRCFVGVPVAGTLPGSDSFDTTSSKKRKGSTVSSVHRTPSTTAKGTKQSKAEVSFSDLLSTRNSSESTDNTITDMVARVGRWWYSRCYESLILPEAGEPDAANSGNLLKSSIWRDEALINECEKRGTSFRLLIGYAQKPEVGVRRTVSV